MRLYSVHMILVIVVARLSVYTANIDCFAGEIIVSRSYPHPKVDIQVPRSSKFSVANLERHGHPITLM